MSEESTTRGARVWRNRGATLDEEVLWEEPPSPAERALAEAWGQVEPPRVTEALEVAERALADAQQGGEEGR